jgi:putative photosynthetic complex assembly protein 2
MSCRSNATSCLCNRAWHRFGSRQAFEVTVIEPVNTAVMLELTIPVVFAVFIWWFSTGLVLLLDGLPRTTFRWSILISSVLAATALYGLAHTSSQSAIVNAYCAFTCALLIWGWHELTFLTGWLTGPRKQPSTFTRGWPRFTQAVAAIIWHELAILASALLIIGITWNAPNQIGLWTFLVLWCMRTSAKLNLFFGVRNLSEEFLPAHLTYMASYFRRLPMNAFFPISVLGALAVLVLMTMRVLHPATSSTDIVGLALVSTMLAMAILEHFLLVVPVPSTALWRWALRNRAAQVAVSAAD